MKKETSNKDYNKLWSISYLIIVVINAFAFINFNMSTSGMPAFANTINDNKFSIGLVTTVCAVSALICRPLAGFCSDKFNSYTISLVGLLLMTVAPLIGVLANDVIWIYILRCIQGLGWGMVSTASAKLIVLNSPKHRVSEAIGYAGSVSSVCAAIAPSVAIMILQKYGINNLMYAIALPTLLATIFILFIYKIKNRYVSKIEKLQFLLSNCFEKKAIVPAILIFVITFCYSPMITFVSPYVASIGVEDYYWFFACYALTTILSRPITGKLLDKYNYSLFGVFAFVFMSISILFLFFMDSIFWLSVSGLFAGMGTGIGVNTFQTMAVKSSTERNTGKAMATFLFGFDFGMALGSVVAGAISEKIGFKPMFFVFSLISLFGIASSIVFCCIKSKSKN